MIASNTEAGTVVWLLPDGCSSEIGGKSSLGEYEANPMLSKFAGRA